MHIMLTVCPPPLHGSVWSTWPLLAQHWVHTGSWECLCSGHVMRYSIKSISSVQTPTLYHSLHTTVWSSQRLQACVSIARSSTSVIHCTNSLVCSRIGFIRTALLQRRTRPPTLHVRDTHAYTQHNRACTRWFRAVKWNFLPVKNSSCCAAMSRSQLVQFLQVGCDSVPVRGPGTKTAVPGSHHKVSLNPFKTNLLVAAGQFSWVSRCSCVSLHF